MSHQELLTILVVIMFAAAITYKLNFFSNRHWRYIPLNQLYYLIVVPGVVNMVIYSEVFDIITRPKNPNIIFGDRFTITLLFMSSLYTYIGIAIHTITKTLSRYFTVKQRKTKAYVICEYFHWDFSHNMVFIGALFTALFFSILDINHTSTIQPLNIVYVTIMGLLVGATGVFALLNYERYSWNHMKIFIISFWMAVVVAFYAAKPYISNINQYPFTAIILISFSMIALFNLFFRTKFIRGKWRLIYKAPRKLFKTVKAFSTL